MTKAIVIATLVAGITKPAFAQAWLDDFNDGNAIDGSPVTWTASPGFPSQFTVLNGELVMTMPIGASPPITSARVPVNFPAGASVRALMIGLNGPGRYSVAFADQPTGIQGYVASFSTCQGGRIELFRGDVPGSITYLGVVLWPAYGPLEEFMIQLDVFDGVVSARVWKPGEPFPLPQITAPDPTYSAGVASVAIQDFGGPGLGGCGLPGNFTNVSALVRFAQASSTPLTHSGAGDIDGDGDVDDDDQSLFVSVLLGADADPLHQARSDLSGDGAADGQDVWPFVLASIGGS